MKALLSLKLAIIGLCIGLTTTGVQATNLPPDTLSLDELFVLLDQQQLAKTEVRTISTVVEDEAPTAVTYVTTEIRFVEHASRFWSAELAMQYVDFIAKEMHAKPNLKLVLIGHRDMAENDPKSANLALQRAELVKATIMKRSITSDRIVVKDMGTSNPKVSKASGYNRRVELVLVK
jgi:outer membrane protein OmpA-like peptidoglycan-associated protein